ncbi:MAG: FHA domain-containing protein, partial [Lentisphaerales bacterium]|nr:FHA domain-containing protein [Lentisphaerales bacterium]
MKFVFLNSSLAGRKVDTDQGVVSIGSDETNLLVIPEPGISAKHCYTVKLDGQWIIFDLESTNGIQINGEKIDKKSEISDFDTIKLADVEFVVLLSEEAKSSINEKKVLTLGKKNSEAAKGLEQRRIKRQKQNKLKWVRNLVVLASLILLGCI